MSPNTRKRKTRIADDIVKAIRQETKNLIKNR